jgi:hypothetical protein
MSKLRARYSGAFIGHTLEMRRSPAWRALPDDARRILTRLEVEHMEHGGAENGNLVCTYNDFAADGVRRASVALALRQCVALGFVEIVKTGKRAIAEFRSPTRYRLTHVIGRGVGRICQEEPSNEWRSIKTADDARSALLRAVAIRNYETQPLRRAGIPSRDIDSRLTGASGSEGPQTHGRVRLFGVAGRTGASGTGRRGRPAS